jgi:hypothetical protein
MTIFFLFYSIHKPGIELRMSRPLWLYRHFNDNDAATHSYEMHQSNAATHGTTYRALTDDVLVKPRLNAALLRAERTSIASPPTTVLSYVSKHEDEYGAMVE